MKHIDGYRVIRISHRETNKYKDNCMDKKVKYIFLYIFCTYTF